MRLVAGALLLIAATAAAQERRGTVITDTLWSQALGANKSIVMYLPPSYRTAPNKRYPVAYYLHGAWGNETNWSVQGRLGAAMDSLIAAGKPEMIVAMPDGDDSWYTTYNYLLDVAGCRRLLPQGQVAERDCVAWPHYDDYIVYDVVRHVDTKFRSIASRESRGIAGLSMGGYGAFSLALRYPGTFSAAASHSGVVWPLEFAPPPLHTKLPHGIADSTAVAGLTKTFAERFRVIFGSDSAGWYSRDPLAIAARSKQSGAVMPAFFADCGTEDFTLSGNRRFRDEMRRLGVPLEYHEWPGAHNWAYWSAHVGESLAWLGSHITPR